MTTDPDRRMVMTTDPDRRMVMTTDTVRRMVMTTDTDRRKITGGRLVCSISLFFTAHQDILVYIVSNQEECIRRFK